ncbi:MULTISPECIES: ABC transporter permease [Arthrobacter]|uniref:ABC transporter permease n=1 Tax=Arthrobacter psychrochitiniphilus TaxID=291045 RepID=A0A2V3DPL1_9MICC|nr:ABC transporter permease [Arthrobacter psychrochitiniphilus]NYG17507.1 peptide/nickel transport system permease protein [Arthrobacter psychrochitiniphilus]PXA64621.1 ABC transporter permease [Arthrobacter psychrochitiniphilus]
MSPSATTSTRQGGALKASLRWLLSTLAGGIFVLWAVATAIFFGIRMIPGDPAAAIMGGPGSQASAEALEAARIEYGLDQPLFVQYFGQLRRLAVGDLGTSYSLKSPVSEVLAEIVPSTLVLAGLALVVAWLMALLLAVLSTRISVVGSAVEIISAAVPHFWLASVLIMIFSTALGWFPPVSTNTPGGLVLPVVTLALPLAGFLGQVMRDSLEKAQHSAFALSARARGESEIGVLLRHSLRHAALPGIALSGWALGSLLSGAVVVESIFARPGLGRALLSAVTARDIPLVTGVALVSAGAYVLIMAVSDLAERLVDPRIGEP